MIYGSLGKMAGAGKEREGGREKDSPISRFVDMILYCDGNAHQDYWTAAMVGFGRVASGRVNGRVS